MIRELNGILMVLLLGLAAIAQEPKEAVDGVVTNRRTSGKQLYVSNCSLCHGTDAKGGGPFSTQLKTWPSDLTLLAKKNNGVFPALHIAEIIDGEFGKPAHGSRDMPIWGPVFRSVAQGHSDSAQRRINGLVRYLESVQQK